MATRLIDTKTGKERGVTYSDRETKRMAQSTSKIPGSALRRTSGLDKLIGLQGRRVTGANRRAVMTAAREGRGGFTRLSSGRSK